MSKVLDRGIAGAQPMNDFECFVQSAAPQCQVEEHDVVIRIFDEQQFVCLFWDFCAGVQDAHFPRKDVSIVGVSPISKAVAVGHGLVSVVDYCHNPSNWRQIDTLPIPFVPLPVRRRPFPQFIHQHEYVGFRKIFQTK
jgi:hypothetical protein